MGLFSAQTMDEHKHEVRTSEVYQILRLRYRCRLLHSAENILAEANSEFSEVEMAELREYHSSSEEQLMAPQQLNVMARWPRAQDAAAATIILLLVGAALHGTKD